MSFLKGMFNKDKKPKVDLKKRFNLISRVGQGSMSKVWRATDRESGKIVALKVLDPVKTANFEARFQGLDKPSEGEIAARLRHPNIARTFEFGTSTDNYQFLIMEYIHGSSLSYLVDMMKDDFANSRLDYIIQLGEAVSYLHRHKWIHRDICPRNVIVNEDKKVKLIDFGLVVPNTPDFQKPGNRTGTASYMAPELIKRQKTDQRLDIFSFSVTSFEMYTKTFPWPSGNLTMEMIIQHINNPPQDIRELMPNIDNQIAETIMRGLEGRVDFRWQTIDAMLGSFKQVRNRFLGIEDDAPPASSRVAPLLAVPDLEKEIEKPKTDQDDFMSILDSAPDLEPVKVDNTENSIEDDIMEELNAEPSTQTEPKKEKPVMSEEEDEIFAYLTEEVDENNSSNIPEVPSDAPDEKQNEDQIYEPESIDDDDAFDDDDDDYYEV